MIKIRCDHCGWLADLRVSQVVLHTAPDDFVGTLTFSCPRCEAANFRVLPPHVARGLARAGAPVVGLTEGATVRMPGWTHDDVLDFHMLLESDDWFERLLAATAVEV